MRRDTARKERKGSRMKQPCCFALAIEAESPQRSEDLERKARPTGARPKIPRPQSRTPPLQGGETPMLQGSIGAGSQLYKS